MVALPRSEGIKKEEEDMGEKQELSASEEVEAEEVVLQPRKRGFLAEDRWTAYEEGNIELQPETKEEVKEELSAWLDL
jgi:hypothetical protein